MSAPLLLHNAQKSTLYHDGPQVQAQETADSTAPRQPEEAPPIAMLHNAIALCCIAGIADIIEGLGILEQ